MYKNILIIKLIISFTISTFLSFFLNKKILHLVNKHNIKENIRNLGIKGEKKKEHAISLGGLIIIISTLAPVLMFTKLTNIYILIIILTTLSLGLLGFYDDYIKIFKKKKEGVSIKFKIIYQLISGLLISYILLSSSHNFIIQENKILFNKIYSLNIIPNSMIYKLINLYKHYYIVFFYIIILLLFIFTTNASNLTDGIDGLLGSLSLIILIIIMILIYISNDKMLSNYLDIKYIPHIYDIMIFNISLIGSIISFLWYNIYPAKLFMGDCGSLTIGGIITIISIIIKQKLIIIIMLLLTILESLTVIIQVVYFKYNKIIHGSGKRLFIMTPIHHHFQKQGYHENKIFSRFIIVQIYISIFTILLYQI